MQAAFAHHSAPAVDVRPARATDLAGLVAVENEVFATDRISRRSFRNFLGSPHAVLIVAEIDGALAGYALVLFRSTAGVARVYSIAVAPHRGRSGIGAALDRKSVV